MNLARYPASPLALVPHVVRPTLHPVVGRQAHRDTGANPLDGSAPPGPRHNATQHPRHKHRRELVSGGPAHKVPPHLEVLNDYQNVISPQSSEVPLGKSIHDRRTNHKTGI